MAESVNAAEPFFDRAQGERLFGALYDGAPGVAYLARYKDVKPREDKDFTEGAFETNEDSRSIALDDVAEGIGEFAFATSMATFAPGTDRCADNSVSIAALSVDVDGDNIKRALPGASIDEAITEFLRLLSLRGIVPHAIVRSGHGFHAYVLIERIVFANDAERDHVEDVAYRLGYWFGGATDRHDLPSFLRLPGTVNRKYGGFERTRFIEEHTDLGRPRYPIEVLSLALTDVKGKNRKRVINPDKDVRGTLDKKARGASLAVTRKAPTDFDRYQLQVAEVLSPGKFARLRKKCRAGSSDRSASELAYACSLLELGFSEEMIYSEISACAKATASADPYLVSTVSRAVTLVYGKSQLETSLERSHYSSTSGWLEEMAFKDQTGPDTPTPLSCGASSKLARLVTVSAPPGYGKTTELIHAGATATRGLGIYDSICMSGRFNSDNLQHERAINEAYPAGLAADLGPVYPNYEYDRNDYPTTDEELIDRMPEQMRRLEDDSGDPFWTTARLREREVDVRAMYVNSRSPWAMDSRCEDQSGPDGEPGKPSPSYQAGSPNALVKFGASTKLCLAGETATMLSKPDTCVRCSFKQCRANRSDEGGMRKLWRMAGVPIQTHQAHRFQQIFAPDLNDFPTVFDELPEHVVRNESIHVFPLEPNAKRTSWRVEPIDTVIEWLRTWEHRDKEKWEDAEPLHRRLESQRARLLKVAQRGTDAKDGIFRKSARMPPLLSNDQLQTLVDLQRAQFSLGLADAAFEGMYADADVEQTGRGTLAKLILTLSDFCGNEELLGYQDVHLEAGKVKDFWLHQPVNGWTSLFCPDGTPRDVTILDATAQVDPRYLPLPGSKFEAYPSAEFPNTKIILPSSRGTVSKAKLLANGDIAAGIARAVAPFRTEIRKLLVITTKLVEDDVKKEIEAAFEKLSNEPIEIAVAHFGNLRGKNDYMEFDAVYLTNLHRYAESYFDGLAMLLYGWDSMSKHYERKGSAERHPGLRYRAMAADIYQDTMRIRLRKDPGAKAHIFLPSREAEFVVRALRMFPGSSLCGDDGRELVPRASPAVGSAKSEENIRETPAAHAAVETPDDAVSVETLREVPVPTAALDAIRASWAVKACGIEHFLSTEGAGLNYDDNYSQYAAGVWAEALRLGMPAEQAVEWVATQLLERYQHYFGWKEGEDADFRERPRPIPSEGVGPSAFQAKFGPAEALHQKLDEALIRCAWKGHCAGASFREATADRSRRLCEDVARRIASDRKTEMLLKAAHRELRLDGVLIIAADWLLAEAEPVFWGGRFRQVGLSLKSP